MVTVVVSAREDCRLKFVRSGDRPLLLAGGGRAEGTQQNARACYTGYSSSSWLPNPLPCVKACHRDIPAVTEAKQRSQPGWVNGQTLLLYHRLGGWHGYFFPCLNSWWYKLLTGKVWDWYHIQLFFDKYFDIQIVYFQLKHIQNVWI